MRLILVDAADTVAQRLARQGWSGYRIGGLLPTGWSMLDDVDAARQLPGPRLWLSAAATLPELGADDLMVSLNASPGTLAPGQNVITAYLQHSVFAPDYGFLLAVGGRHDLIAQAAPLFDALAPAPKAWLYAGSRAAPAFLTKLMQETGENWAGIAARMVAQNPALGLAPWWEQQRGLLARLATEAEAYLAAEGDSDYRPLDGVADPFPFAAPGGRPDDSPAHKLALLLRWLQQQLSTPTI